MAQFLSCYLDGLPKGISWNPGVGHMLLTVCLEPSYGRRLEGHQCEKQKLGDLASIWALMKCVTS